MLPDFFLFSFPCSADHERDWPPCKVVLRVGNQYAECEKQESGYFIEAASRLIRDMCTQGYDLRLLRRESFNFQSTIWKTAKVLGAPTTSKRTRGMFWHKLTSEIYYNATRSLTLG